jgi:hypothetical protein
LHGAKLTKEVGINGTGSKQVIIKIFALHRVKFTGFSTFASIRPHKKAVKKIGLEGAKEK